MIWPALPNDPQFHRDCRLALATALPQTPHSHINNPFPSLPCVCHHRYTYKSHFFLICHKCRNKARIPLIFRVSVKCLVEPAQTGILALRLLTCVSRLRAIRVLPSLLLSLQVSSSHPASLHQVCSLKP